MEQVKAFNSELVSLYETKPPISKAKMTAITKAAMRAIKYYKHVVQGVEKFILKCRPEYKVPGLYVIDSIVRQSRHQFGPEKDVFASRFTRNIEQTFTHIMECPEEEKRKIVRVLNLWKKNNVFPKDVIKSLFMVCGMEDEEMHFSDEDLREKSKTSVSNVKPTTVDNMDFSLNESTDEQSNMQEIDISDSPDIANDASQQQHQSSDVDEVTSNANVAAPSGTTGVDTNLLQQLQALTALLQRTTGVPPGGVQPSTTSPAQSNQVKFDKHLLDYDYGEEDEDGGRNSTSPVGQMQGQAPTVASTSAPTQASTDPITSILTNPDVVRQLQNVMQMSLSQTPTNQNVSGQQQATVVHDNTNSGQSSTIEQRQQQQQQQISQQTEEQKERQQPQQPPMFQLPPQPFLPFAQPFSPFGMPPFQMPFPPFGPPNQPFPPGFPFMGPPQQQAFMQQMNQQLSQRNQEQSNGSEVVTTIERIQQPPTAPFISGSANAASLTFKADGQTKTAEEDVDDRPEFVMEKKGSDPLEIIDLDHVPTPPPSPPRLSRSDSRSRSRYKSKSKSRSGSRSRSRSRRYKRYRSRSRSYSRNRYRDRERRRRALPPVKRNHLAVCSTTLWVGHLSKLVQEEDLSDLFGEIGDIVSIDLIPPRGCAFLCMNRRQDAAKAMDKLRSFKLHGKSITIAWAPGKGMKGKEWKDYWEADYGVSYIPWSKLSTSTDYEIMEEGSMLDYDTMPEWLKRHLEEKAKRKPKIERQKSIEMEDSANATIEMGKSDADLRSTPFFNNTTSSAPTSSAPSNVSEPKPIPPPPPIGIPMAPGSSPTPIGIPPVPVNLMNPFGLPPRLLTPVGLSLIPPPVGVPPPVPVSGLLMQQQQQNILNRLPQSISSPFPLTSDHVEISEAKKSDEEGGAAEMDIPLPGDSPTYDPDKDDTDDNEENESAKTVEMKTSGTIDMFENDESKDSSVVKNNASETVHDNDTKAAENGEEIKREESKGQFENESRDKQIKTDSKSSRSQKPSRWGVVEEVPRSIDKDFERPFRLPKDMELDKTNHSEQNRQFLGHQSGDVPSLPGVRPQQMLAFNRTPDFSSRPQRFQGNPPGRFRQPDFHRAQGHEHRMSHPRYRGPRNPQQRIQFRNIRGPFRPDRKF